MAVMTIVNPVPPLNFRDVGGLVTDTGRSTRPNVLFRSDALYAGDQPGPQAWPPATGATARRRRERVAAFGLELRHSAVPDEFFDVSADAINAVLDVVAGPAADDGASGWLIAHGTDEATISTWSARLTGDQR